MNSTRTSTELTPGQLRQLISESDWTSPTSGHCDGYQQANLVVVPGAVADEFVRYCALNPSVCPLLGQTEPGDRWLNYDGCTVDVTTMIPRYRVWQDGGVVAEPTNLGSWWRADSVAFALGCSHTLDGPLRAVGVPVSDQAPPVYVTTIPTRGNTRFDGLTAMSMRPVRADLVDRAIEVTAAIPTGHGQPVHVGDPTQIGIEDLSAPDFGVFVGVAAGHVPLFWNCGVTPQLAIAKAGLSYAATHYPGHMLVLDAEVRPR